MNSTTGKKRNDSHYRGIVLLGTILASVIFFVHFHTLNRFLVQERQLSSSTPSAFKRSLRQFAPTSKFSSNKQDSIAILIAGQCHRLTYKDQSGPLFAAGDNKYKVDVYLALQCGTKFQPFTGQADTPKYMETLNVTDIEQWYLNRGANKVTIKVLYDEALNEIFEDVSRHAHTIYREEEYGFKLEYLLGTPRWPTEVRKYYLRHLVFSMAQKVQQYTGYVMLREDNYFFEPFDLGRNFLNQNKTEDQPFVIVDEHCEFNSYSDKIYITNHPGAASLFSSTKAEFMLFMKRLLLFAYFRKQSDVEYLQAERFEHDTILMADVKRMDLKRVDTRYVNGQRCIPELYYTCQPLSHQKLAVEHNLAICERVPALAGNPAISAA